MWPFFSEAVHKLAEHRLRKGIKTAVSPDESDDRRARKYSTELIEKMVQSVSNKESKYNHFRRYVLPRTTLLN